MAHEALELLGVPAEVRLVAGADRAEALEGTSGRSAALTDAAVFALEGVRVARKDPAAGAWNSLLPASTRGAPGRPAGGGSRIL